MACEIRESLNVIFEFLIKNVNVRIMLNGIMEWSVIKWSSPCNLARRPIEAEIYLYSFCNLVARWGWVVNATPAPLYPLHSRLGGLEGEVLRTYKYDLIL
jgi:hypothetical protein